MIKLACKNIYTGQYLLLFCLKNFFWGNAFLRNFFFSVPRLQFLSLLLLSLLLPLHSSASEPSPNSKEFTSSSTSHLPLKAFTAKYSAVLNGSKVRGSATRQLINNANGESIFSFNAKVNIAKLAEESLFHWNQCTPIPKAYNRSLRVFFRIKKQSIQFDHQKLKVQYTYDKKSGEADIPENTLDRISLQLALRCDLKQGKYEGSYAVFDRKRVKEYQFKTLGEEEIETPIGKLLATKVQLLRKNKNRQTWLWFSKQHDYLLVKLKQNESSSENLEITISEIEII